jgi:hypothetical protein
MPVGSHAVQMAPYTIVLARLARASRLLAAIGPWSNRLKLE